MIRRNLRLPRVRSSTATSSWLAGSCARFAVGAADRAERADGDASASAEVQPGPERAAHLGGERFGLAAHDEEAGLVDDRAVVGEPVELVVVGGRADLGHADLDLVGLLLLGEDRAERLRVGVGQRAGGDVAPVVGVAAQVGQPDAGDAQVLVLVVLADAGEARSGRRSR